MDLSCPGEQCKGQRRCFVFGLASGLDTQKWPLCHRVSLSSMHEISKCNNTSACARFSSEGPGHYYSIVLCTRGANGTRKEPP